MTIEKAIDILKELSSYEIRCNNAMHENDVRRSLKLAINALENYDLLKDKLLKELSFMDNAVVGISYHYAKNLVNYGVDVTKEWNKLIEKSEALDKAYNKGYLDAIKNKYEYKRK